MIVVDGKIKSKQRPRFGKGKVFTPTDTINYENWIKTCYQQQGGQHLEGNIKVSIIACFAVPKSMSKKDRAKVPTMEIRPLKMDADNIAKIILDGLNGVAYKDDRQVAEIEVKKYYTLGNERIEFDIWEI